MGIFRLTLQLSNIMFLCAAFLLVAFGVLECNGQVNPKALKLGGKEYHCSLGKKTSWEDANRNCKANGMRLAMPKNTAIQKQIYNECCKVNPHGDCWVWLGARKENWATTTGGWTALRL